MRKIHVKLTVDLLINAEEGIPVSEIIQEMDYDFSSQIDGADIESTEIVDFEVVDSR